MVFVRTASQAEREVLEHDTTQPTSTPQVELVPAADSHVRS
jgi:hypothetical protein